MIAFVLGIIFLQVCSGPANTAITWREQWELVILTEDGGLVDARITVANTGLLRNQGHLRANRWSATDSPILFALDGGPGDVDVSDTRDAVRVGSALLGRYESGDNWTLRVSDDTANAIIHIDPGGPSVPLARDKDASGQWTMSAAMTHGSAHGWFTAGRRGGMFEGRAIAIQRGGDANPSPRIASFVVGGDVSIGVDEQGNQRLAWARIGDMDISMESLRQLVDDAGNHTLDFRPSENLVVRLPASAVGGVVNHNDHLYGPERMIAQWTGFSQSRSIFRAQAEIAHNGELRTVSGVILRSE